MALNRDCFLIIFQVGGYILGEFGNLIAGDARSAPLVQFRLLHSKYHLCSQGMYYMFYTNFKMIRQFHVKNIYISLFFSLGTRALLLTTYVKFINLFPEIKTVIEGVFSLDSNIRSADAELQQRACEYLALSKHATLDVLATVLEEMPPFPEKGKLN